MRGDMDMDETKLVEQQRRLEAFIDRPDIAKRSVTILEIGAGPAQPLAREYAQLFYQNQKYRCCLIRINPVKERTAQYQHEQSQFQKLARQYKVVEADGSSRVSHPLTASEVPNFLEDDVRHLVHGEESEIAKNRNDLIEIQLGAKEGLGLLLKYVQGLS